MNNLIIISGCSGGGKSTLLAELHSSGHAVIEEPGRRIVARELQNNGRALPWIDPAAFARQALALAEQDHSAARSHPGQVFFDRSMIDAAAALEHATGEPALEALRHAHRYHPLVFLAPPWPAIYQTDSARRHDFTAAVAEYDRLCVAYPSLGYEIRILPKTGVKSRAAFIAAALNEAIPVKI